MTTSALAMMITWCGLVTIMTGYFFYRVLTNKPKNEDDSEIKNPDSENLD